MDGIINIDKPAGITSARVVDRVKRLLARKTKVGHAGTLDPFATGVLLVLVGRGTKRCEQLMGEAKVYEADVKLGANTVTDDLESPEEPRVVVTPPGREAVEAALGGFVGEIEQRPPVYSAMKVGGRRAYDLARRGEAVALQPRRVRVYSAELLAYAWPIARVRIEYGLGTYIRSIARDLGEALGTGGYLTALRRTRSGGFSVEGAVTLEALAAEGVERHLVALETLGS